MLLTHRAILLHCLKLLACIRPNYTRHTLQHSPLNRNLIKQFRNKTPQICKRCPQNQKYLLPTKQKVGWELRMHKLYSTYTIACDHYHTFNTYQLFLDLLLQPYTTGTTWDTLQSSSSPEISSFNTYIFVDVLTISNKDARAYQDGF